MFREVRYTIIVYRALRLLGLSRQEIFFLMKLFYKQGGFTMLKDWKTTLFFGVAAMCGYLATVPDMVVFSEILKAVAALALAVGGYFTVDKSKKVETEVKPEVKPETTEK